jgi:hypothetical protein
MAKVGEEAGAAEAVQGGEDVTVNEVFASLVSTKEGGKAEVVEGGGVEGVSVNLNRFWVR